MIKKSLNVHTFLNWRNLTSNFALTSRAKTTKILIDTLKARREIKNEFMDIQTVFEAMKNALKKEIEQGYTYSEDFLTEVFGEEN